MLSIRDLGMHYGPKILFTDVNLNLNSGFRYGLIGANGAGKSTFFKILMAEEQPSIGEVIIQKNSTVGWLRQDLIGFEDELIINCVIAGKPDLWKQIEEKEKLLNKSDFTEEDGYKLAAIEEKIADLDGYVAESEAEIILTGLGIPEEKHHQPLSVLSGGYKLRVLLAQSLFQNPDILLLDEPTNHLDIVSIKWLEEYLKRQFNGLLIFISHDTGFLNNLSTHILDVDYHEVNQYTGNYSKFKKEKLAKHEQLLSQKESAEKRIAKAKQFIERFRAGTRSRQAASREKILDKMEIDEIKNTTRIAPNFSFSKKRPSGKMVLEIENIKKSYGDKTVLQNINCKISRGEKVAIVGQNGLGKSTLLKIISGNLAADEGSFAWGAESSMAYFSQDHHDLLNYSTSVIQWLEDQSGGQNTEQDRRKILGKMLFSGDEVHKNILDISGGESARLLFAHIMLQNANILVLDEPTNHMDIETISALSSALKKYDGTIIFVSHDRSFLSSFASRLITITPKGVKSFHNGFSEFEKSLEQVGK
jgi:ATPase subunit of ABC transporter with duplicated ATPase domains